jgi:hypothetical protein
VFYDADKGSKDVDTVFASLEPLFAFENTLEGSLSAERPYPSCDHFNPLYQVHPAFFFLNYKKEAPDTT